MSTHRKLRLNVQDLEVESFDPALRAAGRGTVVGHNLTQQLNCYTFKIDCPYSETLACSAYSCYRSCPATCDPAGCEPIQPTQEATCLDATCCWAGGVPFYDGNC